MKTSNIVQFLDALSLSVDDENIKLYKSIVEQSSIKSFDNPEEFYFSVLYPFENYINSFLKLNISSNEDVVFIYQNYNFLDNHIEKLFIMYEGTPCSADKSRSTINNLIQFYLTGKNIDYDYTAEYTYHLPSKILKKHVDIIGFYTALKKLYYGDNKEYLKMLHAINCNI